MAATPGRLGNRARLGLWIALPLLGQILLLQLADGLPTPECGEGGGASSAEMTLFLVAMGLATVAATIAAAARLRALQRRPDLSQPRASRVLAAAAVLLLAGAVVAWFAGASPLLGVVIAFGSLLTVGSLLVLLVAWALGRSVDGVGLLLPLYLLGAGLIGYPAILVLVAVAQSGLGC